MSKYRFQQIEPQPARGKFHEGLWTDPNWIAEEKYDGDRRIAQFCGNVVRFTGRRISVKDGLFVEKTENVPHLSGLTSLGNKHARGIVGSKAPPASLEGTVLDGEMVFLCASDLPKEEGGRSKYVTSIMGSLPEEAVRKQIERGWLRYVVFDCLRYKGKDITPLPYRNRRECAEAAVKEWGNPFASISLLSGLMHHQRKGFYEKIVASGGEGVILKRLDAMYGDKSGWVKVKRTATADVVIMGFIPAKEMSKKKGEDQATLTKYAKAGLIGAVQVGQYRPARKDEPRAGYVLEEVATISGMDDALRADFTVAPGSFIGKVVKIEHNGREPTGRFRHPRFDGFRNDKRAKDCVIYDGEV
jgi:bifunctional non-homologous end joining protein LigD